MPIRQRWGWVVERESKGKKRLQIKPKSGILNVYIEGASRMERGRPKYGASDPKLKFRGVSITRF